MGLIRKTIPDYLVPDRCTFRGCRDMSVVLAALLRSGGRSRLPFPSKVILDLVFEDVASDRENVEPPSGAPP